VSTVLQPAATLLREGLPQQHSYDLIRRHCLDADETGDRLGVPLDDRLRVDLGKSGRHLAVDSDPADQLCALYLSEVSTQGGPDVDSYKKYQSDGSHACAIATRKPPSIGYAKHSVLRNISSYPARARPSYTRS